MSSTEDLRHPVSYRDIATLRGERVLIYREFGSYQGEWVMVSLRGDEYLLYRGYYGSCSGCDDLQATSFVTQEDVDKFIAEYRPFAEIPRVTARKLATNNTFKQVFPGNYRESYSDIDTAELVAEIEVQVRLEEDLPVTKEDAMRAMSQETRRRVLERLDVPSLIDLVIDIDGFDQLVRIEGEVYLYVKDGSTERRYLIGVPPEMQRVREAKAWTFDLQEEEYAPVVET